MKSSREGEICGGGETGGGKQIDSTEEGSFDSNTQQTKYKEDSSIKQGKNSEMSNHDITKKDEISEDSRNPTFVVIEQCKNGKKVNSVLVT